MIQAIAIDDEPPALKVLEHCCSRTDKITLQRSFTQTAEALKYLERFPVDLLFLDINMPSISGIDFYKQIPQPTMVIFTTAYSDYAVEGFNLNAIDYLLKPFTFDRFEQAITKATEYFQYSKSKDFGSQRSIFIRADYALVKIGLCDISYIEGLDDYLKIHLEQGKPLVTRMTMKAILEKLPAADFVRVHRSFIVPYGKVKSLRHKAILVGTREIPLGASYEQAFLTAFNKL